MSSAECLRDLINERLTAAAEEIFRAFLQTVSQYEEQIDRQRRLLEVVLKPQVKLHRTELPLQHVCKEEEVLQDRKSSLDQQDPEPPQVKEEQEELCTSLILKQETETFMLTPACEESDNSADQTVDWSPDETVSAAEKEHVVSMSVQSSAVQEANSDDQLLSHSSHVAESQDHKGGKHGDSGSTGNAENRLQKSKSHTEGKKTYTGKRCFECDTCGKSFQYKSKLHTHLRVHTGEKPYPCNICEKRFRQRGALKPHMKIHTGEKPYPCNTCEKRFSHLGTLKKHMRVHTGEKPYPCNTCEKRFSHLGTLKEHMRIHTGEKPYNCKTCGLKFRFRHHFKKHMRTHVVGKDSVRSQT